MLTSEIGRAFVDFYQDRGHQILPGAALLDPSIPMTFVMSAGLVQIEVARDQTDRRVGDKYALLQKCFRHFDVERVGTSSLHLSLFEMPGAFFFGPDGKSDMICQMWTLLTEHLQIRANHLWVTYFAGGEVAGHLFEEDVETVRAWADIGVPSERLVGLGAGANFWMQGPGIEGTVRYRKCGPHTEVFFDRGADLSCGRYCFPACRCGRFVEVGNTLFLSIELDTETGQLHPLTTPFTETVIGTERVAMISQGAQSVFHIDCLRPAVLAIRQFRDAQDLPQETVAASENTLADHLRALLCLVADGAPPPGKNGRERIVKILARRVLTCQEVLGINSPAFFPTVLEAIVDAHREWPKLGYACSKALRYLADHSKLFQKTMTRGHRQLEQYLSDNDGVTLTGQQIVSLEKDYGMPSLLVMVALRDRALPMEHAGYKLALEKWHSTRNTLHQSA